MFHAGHSLQGVTHPRLFSEQNSEILRPARDPLPVSRHSVILFSVLSPGRVAGVSTRARPGPESYAARHVVKLALSSGGATFRPKQHSKVH